MLNNSNYDACLVIGTQLENFIFTENYDFENAFINQTFWPCHDVLAQQNDDYYVIEVQTNWNNGKIEYDGRIVRWDNTCTIIHQKSVRCITETGPAELYRKINKSHMETEWTWTWKDFESKNLKRSQKKFKLKSDRKHMIFSFSSTLYVFARRCVCVCVLIQIPKNVIFFVNL